MQLICLIIIVSLPLVRFGAGLAKIQSKEGSVFLGALLGELVYLALSYTVLFYAGVFGIFESAL